jgi:hypothetical protein
MTTMLPKRHGRRAVAAASIAPLLLLAGAGAAAATSGPLTWTFDKCAVSATAWEGTTSGLGQTTGLRTDLTSARQSGQILHVTFDWNVQGVFVASLEGTLNLGTGAVVMNGTVASGDLEGSRVHEEGQLYDAARGCFAGTVQVFPAS